MIKVFITCILFMSLLGCSQDQQLERQILELEDEIQYITSRIEFLEEDYYIGKYQEICQLQYDGRFSVECNNYKNKAYSNIYQTVYLRQYDFFSLKSEANPYERAWRVIYMKDCCIVGELVMTTKGEYSPRQVFIIGDEEFVKLDEEVLEVRYPKYFKEG